MPFLYNFYMIVHKSVKETVEFQKKHGLSTNRLILFVFYLLNILFLLKHENCLTLCLYSWQNEHNYFD